MASARVQGAMMMDDAPAAAVAGSISTAATSNGNSPPLPRNSGVYPGRNAGVASSRHLRILEDGVLSTEIVIFGLAFASVVSCWRDKWLSLKRALCCADYCLSVLLDFNTSCCLYHFYLSALLLLFICVLVCVCCTLCEASGVTFSRLTDEKFPDEQLIARARRSTSIVVTRRLLQRAPHVSVLVCLCVC